LADASAIMPVAATGFDEAFVRSLSGRLEEPAPLLSKRLEALRILRQLPPPDRSAHLWRYTSPGKLLPPGPPEVADPGAGLVEAPSVPDGGAVVVVAAGRAPRITISDAAAAAGLEILPVAASATAVALLGRGVPSAHGVLEALNAAGWTSALLVRVPRNAVIPGAVHVVTLAGPGWSAPRLVVEAGMSAVLTLVEDHRGGGEGAYISAVTETSLHPGANVRHVLLQRLDTGTVAHATTRTAVARDASLTTVLASFGGSLVKMDVGAILEGPGAASEIVGFVLGEGSQHMDHHTVHEHMAPNTRSNIDFKVALTGHARSAYTGIIRIDTGAPGSEAYQENRNLLLSERCRADTIPELEIMTDDVSCSHGATVAPLDPEQVFYLQSRGIPGAEAQRLIVRGFVDPALSRMPPGLREPLEAIIAQRIGRFLHEDDTDDEGGVA